MSSHTLSQLEQAIIRLPRSRQKKVCLEKLETLKEDYDTKARIIKHLQEEAMTVIESIELIKLKHDLESTKREKDHLEQEIALYRKNEENE